MSARGERTHLPGALVVGACGVMGSAIARRLGQRHQIYLADINETAVHEAAATLRREGASAVPLVCDVTSSASIAAAMQQIELAGGLRALVHVAALSPSMGSWDRVLTVNLVGATRVVEAVAPILERNGAAVLIGSIGGHMVHPTTAETAVLDAPLAPAFLDALVRAHEQRPDSTRAYMWSKWGLMRLSRRLAGPWGARGRRIVTVSPGFIATTMGDLEFRHQPAKHDLMARLPLPRLGSVAEVADAVEFLASDRASYITGTDLLIDGGMSAIL